MRINFLIHFSMLDVLILFSCSFSCSVRFSEQTGGNWSSVTCGWICCLPLSASPAASVDTRSYTSLSPTAFLSSEFSCNRLLRNAFPAFCSKCVRGCAAPQREAVPEKLTHITASHPLCDESPLPGHESRLPGKSKVNTSLTLMALPICWTMDC